MMPPMASEMPANFFMGMSSPKKRQPPIRMMTVFTWPTTCRLKMIKSHATHNVW